MSFTESRRTAPELRVNAWIDADGQRLDSPLRLADLGAGYRIIYCFQHWCPGCHSHGFPTLRLLYDKLKDKGVGFAVIQTVFEGADTNTFDKLRVNQQKYALSIPFGHDLPADGKQSPSFMEDYRSGGTPWFTVIDAAGKVVHADFQLDAAQLIRALDTDRAD
ncbi:peroxiredoxin family protein [Halomonas cupida]|uniref:peroxiredoxin family protein n=1 Tax=Halomonas cupida TaxID=44933 RepID=UPI003A9496A1